MKNLISFAPAAIAILLLSPAQAHSLTKGFNAAFVPLNGTVGLTIGIVNADPMVAINASFLDNLPTGLIVASPNGFSTNGACGTAGANFTAILLGNTIQLSTSSIPPGPFCTFFVNLKATSLGPKPNTVTGGGDLTGLTGTDTTTVVAPVLTKTFAAPTVALSSITQFTITVDNSANTIAMPNLGFNDVIPGGLTGGNIASNSCGGTITGLPAAVNLAGGIVGAGAMCSVVVNVTATTTGGKLNTVFGDPGTNLENQFAADKTNVVAPVLSKAFAPTIVSAGQAGTLTFTINNNTTIPLDNLLGFTDTVPAGITVTGLNTNGCPGTVVTTATTVTYTTVGGNILAVGAVCTITVNIVGVTLGGPYTNTVIGNKSLTGQTPTAQITVIAPPDSFLVRYGESHQRGRGDRPQQHRRQR